MADTNPSEVLPDWTDKENISASKLNRTNRVVNRLLEGVEPPQQVVPNPMGVLVRQFKIVSIQGDYYVCNPYNGVSADTGTSIKIARPPLHRNTITSRNGVAFTYSNTQQRTATQGATVETQKITPSVLVGDVIYAIGGDINGGVGVQVGTEFLKWVDLNSDGRAWAKQ